MGICTSLNSKRKNKNSEVKANKPPNKIDNLNIDKELASSRMPHINKGEKILGKIEKKELKRNNTVNISFNKNLNNSNSKNTQSSQIEENLNKENIPIFFNEKKNENELNEKKDNTDQPIPSKSKEENTLASLKM